MKLLKMFGETYPFVEYANFFDHYEKAINENECMSTYVETIPFVSVLFAVELILKLLNTAMASERVDQVERVRHKVPCDCGNNNAR